MTIVVGFNAGPYAIVSGDSRLTENTAVASIDCCQKVLAIGKRTVVGFSGHLDAVADLLASIRLWHTDRPDDVTVENLKANLPNLLRAGWADFCRLLKRKNVYLGILVTGQTASGACDMFLCESPAFVLEEIPPGAYGVMGSGAPAVERCGDQLATTLTSLEPWLNNQGIEAQYALGWLMGNLLDSYLRKLKIESVGRVFHTILLDTKGAWCVPYEMTQPGSPVRIGTRKGNKDDWVQYRSDGTEIPLLDPVDIVTRWRTLPRVWNLSTRRP
jgi:hypothetical protein